MVVAMNFFADLYYGLWAQISDYQQIDRAALVLIVFWLIIWIIAILILPKLIKLLLLVSKSIIKILYIFFSDYIFPIFLRKNYISIVNRFSNFMEKYFNKINMPDKTKKKKRKLHLGKLIVLYLLSVFLIALPELLSPIISSEYLEVFSFASVAYNEFESKQLEIAETYNPILITSDDDSFDDNAELIEMLIIEDVNFREGPSTSYDRIKVLKKNTIVHFIEKSDDKKWYHIKTEDGLEGWVHSKHIKFK